jgi:hypothetical protein
MKNLYLNQFSMGRQNSLSIYGSPLKSVSTTFYPHDILEINLEDYYKIHIKGLFQPLYLQQNAKLLNESAESKNILEIVHRLGRRRILGVDPNHQIVEMEIDRVQNIAYQEEENLIETPFFALGFIRDQQLQSNLILMDHVFVELD